MFCISVKNTLKMLLYDFSSTYIICMYSKQKRKQTRHSPISTKNDPLISVSLHCEFLSLQVFALLVDSATVNKFCFCSYFTRRAWRHWNVTWRESFYRNKRKALEVHKIEIILDEILKNIRRSNDFSRCPIKLNWFALFREWAVWS